MNTGGKDVPTHDGMGQRHVSKLADVSLRRMAEEDCGQPVSVLVEVNTPGPRIAPEQPHRGDARRWPYIGRIEPETAADQSRLEEARIEVDRLLRKVGQSEPVWLSASRAFAVTTTADHLWEIADAPSVRRITENRLRR